jgi:hypothetical protein
VLRVILAKFDLHVGSIKFNTQNGSEYALNFKNNISNNLGYVVAQLVEALWYKPEGCGSVS